VGPADLKANLKYALGTNEQSEGYIYNMPQHLLSICTVMMRKSSRLLREYKINPQTNKPQTISKVKIVKVRVG
jgi:hypothetical protein